MTGKTHIAIGIAAALTISYGQPLENQSVIVLVSAISSLIPDLDHPKGKINQKILLVKNNFYRVSFYVLVGIVFTYLYYLSKLKFLLFLGIGSFLVGISSHRGFTHSIVGFLASTTIVSLGKLDYGLDSIYSGFIIGYFLHIVADLFTSKGVKLFYPLNNKISFPITFKTNSKFENILFRLLVIYCVWLLLIQVI
jgi:inner membrane protein